MPPAMRGGQPAADFDPEIAESKPQERTPSAPTAVQLVKAVPSMIVTEPVRSGQSIYFPDGDVTIVGSVASGAEVVAGGSIHVYGALRGRAMAGTAGNADARIFVARWRQSLSLSTVSTRRPKTWRADCAGRPCSFGLMATT